MTYHGKNHFDRIEEDELAEAAALAQHISKLSRDNRYIDDRIIASAVNSTLQASILPNRRAPLVTLSSLIVSSVDNQDGSLGSDTVFSGCIDTDDEVDQFSDSDATSLAAARPTQPIQSTVCADIELTPRQSAAEPVDARPSTSRSSNATRPNANHDKCKRKTVSEVKGARSGATKSLPPSPCERTINHPSNIVDNRQRLSLIVNPSVILELPVMAATPDSIEIDTDLSTDPSLSATSRKWSKETLF